MVGGVQEGGSPLQEQQDRPLAMIGPSCMTSSELTSVVPSGIDRLPCCTDGVQREVLSMGSEMGVTQQMVP